MTTQQRHGARGSAARQRETRGFTLTEMLTVVAIIVILFAVMAPNVIAARKRLEVSRLNARAQAIYNTVQNRVTALQSNGNLQKLSDRIDGSSLITTRPADYKDSWATAAEWQTDYSLYYFEGASDKYKGTGVKTNEALTELLLSDEAGQISRELYNGKWLVELSPTTGEVYAVYYWEGDLDDASGSSRQAQLDGYLANDTLDDEGHGCMVGYFCGGPIDKTIRHARQRFDDLRWRLVNSEDLYVAVCSDDLDDLNPSQLKLTVTVTGARRRDGKQVSWRYTTTGDKLGMQLGDTEIDVVLDSLRSGSTKNNDTERMCFSNIMRCYFGGTLYSTADCTGDPVKNPTPDDIIMPGTDIDVSVVTEYISDDGKTEMGLSSKSVEPFADGWIRTNASTQNLTTLTTNSSVGAYSKDDNGTVYVWATRHLENLRMTDDNSPYYNWETSREDTRTDFKHIVLAAAEETANDGYTGNKVDRSADTFMNGIATGDIDFAWENYGELRHCVAMPSRTADAETGVMNPLSFFRPITFYNDRPFGKDSSITGVNGSDGAHTISNFIIKNNADGTGNNVGLFAELGMSVTSLDLVNFTVKGGSNVGALAGTLDGDGSGQYADLNDVHVYVTNTTSAGSIDYGSCGISGISGSGSAIGGIVGNAGWNTKFLVNCSASINVANTSNGSLDAGQNQGVGGLIGYGMADDVGNCSFGIDHNDNGKLGTPTISSKRAHVGGIFGSYVGDGKTGSIDSCTVIATITGEGSTVGGICGSAENFCALTDCNVGRLADGTLSPSIMSISGSTTDLGGLVGSHGGGDISKCNAVVALTGSASSNVGGLVGNQTAYITLANCTVGTAKRQAAVTSTVDNTGGDNTGGFIGTAPAGAKVDTGTVLASVSDQGGSNVGGVAGFVDGSISINNVAVGSDGSKASVWANKDYAGGLVGNIENGANVITGCTVISDATASGTNGFIGGLVGYQKAGSLNIASCNVGSPSQIVSIYGLGHNIAGLVGSVGSKKNGFTQLNVTGNSNSDKSYVLANIYSTGGGNHVAGLVGHDGGTSNYANYRVGLAGLGDRTIGVRSFVQNDAGVSEDCEFVGGLVAEHEGGNIFNCDVIANIQGASLVGGFVGDAQGSSDEFGSLTYSAPIHRQDDPNALFAGIYATPFTSGSNSYVGGGFGRLDASKVVGCSVEANVYNTNVAGSSATNKNASYTGGFVGLIDSDSSGRLSIESSHVSGDFSSNPAAAAYIQADTNYVGGFIGSAGTRNVDIKRNYAAVAVLPITAYTGGTNNQSTDLSVYVGGFIGYLNNTGALIDECYSSGIGRTGDDVRVNNPGYDSEHISAVGGFVGRIASGKIQNSYSTSNVMGNQYTGGFAGYLDDKASIVNSIAYGLVSGDQSDTTHPFAGAANGASANNNRFLAMPGYNEGVTDPFASAADYAALATASNEGHPYTAALGSTFPFPTVINDEHYGDWPAKVVQSNVTWSIKTAWGNSTQPDFKLQVDAPVGWKLVVVFDRNISTVDPQNCNATIQGNTVILTSKYDWNATRKSGDVLEATFSTENAGQPTIVSAELR